VVISFTYFDTIPWPVEADGDGYSLVSKEANPKSSPDSSTYWTISKIANGSPGLNDEASVTAIDQLAAQTLNFEVYPNPSKGEFYINFNLNAETNLEIILFDINGRMLEVFEKGKVPAGVYSRFIQPKKMYQPGIYLIALRTGNSVQTKKLVIQ
jgi:hypothetical protein